MKTFQVPISYRSPLISAVKEKRRMADKMKKDFSPTLLDFGPVRIYLARHFGFCYGVENAIDIAFRTISENPEKNIFLLSEMIHNPQVNEDLQNQGIRFLQNPNGEQLISFDDLQPGDIVITPAFGTSLEIDAILKSKDIHTEQYNTTCPFVEKVWNRSGQIADKNFTVIIHGKPGHEETRATFSRAASGGPALVIRDMEEARLLAAFIRHDRDPASFFKIFRDRYSKGFDPSRHLERIGVVNQTTMLASETQGIADFLKQEIRNHHSRKGQPDESVFADTRDTLCYATNDNQSSVSSLLQTPADLAIVVGGYNSSNTSHLVELCEQRLPTYFISSEKKILSKEEILHFDLHQQQEISGTRYLKGNKPLNILLTCGASCPDAIVEAVITRLTGFFANSLSVEEMLQQILTSSQSHPGI
ncbi:MAG: 4-hydroxy-3-methylbut-2-enyl diphosphate reductase [Bacteroidota bacterium]|nr:4-hydroxy-3-methylbut-2-enyl diphosphate reductase [Bacteroidota bacterium]MDP4212741.1 4-hydroxy-3-methylbut-2-enyl diphosphate reductase [Bacteroidota bacterium]MDP4249354.1 4-hydroxy-3-methylbut-2-enyl diphosphate reductase [Bacteroidota bacterium]